ncbi:MAG: AAA family ATPase [Cyclobacteriaceae bacterium]|nr:AAA family ATPase [Cyclobacteriaceae bacterium]
MYKTQLKKLVVEEFRALKNVEVEFGNYITVICGKNGTSKSSILGIAAQIFSFEKDYTKDESISFRQIAGGSFKSKYSEHFRISKTFDQPGSMKVNIELYDGYTDQAATAKLELMKRDKSSRPVVRHNSTVIDRKNTSRNFTHPVIFLSLKRLYPIADREYEKQEFDYLKKHEWEFISLNNKLLNRSSSVATGTDGTISSAVAHGQNYDHESVSAGEDNAGQIILALMSFRKLKEEYPDYKGGLLLIDEADAGLFPTAQVNLLKMLGSECRKLNLQVVMTSHSPTLIQHAFEQSQRNQKDYKTVYLSDSLGDVKVYTNYSWELIDSDIHTTNIPETPKVPPTKVPVYFEDKEAADFFAKLMSRQPIKKFTNPLPDISLGCSNYLQLIKKKIVEFSKESIICLDADVVQTRENINKYKNIVLLPGELPPDQLIFEHLYNLPPDDPFWNNNCNFTRPWFTNCSSDVISEFNIHSDKVNLQKQIEAYTGTQTPREIFKNFYKNDEFQKLVSSHNPWQHWIDNHPQACNEFLEKFKSAIHYVMKTGYAVDDDKLSALKIKPHEIQQRRGGDVFK